MPNPTEPTAPSGEEQAVTIGRETYVRNGTSWRHHHRWGPIVCDETSDILSRLSALHTEMERTRAALEKYGQYLGYCTTQHDTSAECDCGYEALVWGSPDDTTRRTE